MAQAGRRSGGRRRTAYRTPLFLTHISVSLYGKSWPPPTGFHTFYVVRILITHAGCPVHALKIGPAPLDARAVPASLPCSCVPSHANEHKMLVLRYRTVLAGSSDSKSEVTAKDKLSDRSTATRPARRPPSRRCSPEITCPSSTRHPKRMGEAWVTAGWVAQGMA